MKKAMALILAFTMIISLTACKTDSGVSSPESDTGKINSEPIVLKVGNSQNDSHPWNIAISELKSLVKEYSDGQLEIVNYPNATLGEEADLLESVKEGSLDMAIVDPTVGSPFSKELELFALPFLFRDYDHWEKVFDGEIGKKYNELIQEKTGMKILGVWGGSVRNVIATKKQVEDADDFKGFKLRLAPSDLKFKVWEAVGALPVSIAFGETYSALSSGLADGMENEMPSILSAKFYEPAPYFTLTQHEITVRPMFINMEKFNSLDKELQDALVKAMDETTIRARELEREVGISAEKEMVEKYGISIVDIDKAPIIERTRPIFEEFGESSGTTEIIEEILNLN